MDNNINYMDILEHRGGIEILSKYSLCYIIHFISNIDVYCTLYNIGIDIYRYRYI